MNKYQFCVIFAIATLLLYIPSGCASTELPTETIDNIEQALTSLQSGSDGATDDTQLSQQENSSTNEQEASTAATANSNGGDVSADATQSDSSDVTNPGDAGTTEGSSDESDSDDVLLPPVTNPPIAPPSVQIPDEYLGFTIDALTARTYGEGSFEIEQFLGSAGPFLRYLINYESDGLSVHGFMNIPVGASAGNPAPVVLILHGYITPERYNTFPYTTHYADRLAEAGYITIHPNYRNHPPSDIDPTYGGAGNTADFRVGYAIDVLELVGIIQKQGGLSNISEDTPDELAAFDPANVGLLGHSMGGGMTLRAITVNPTIKAAVVYGAMSGDELLNHERILILGDGARGNWRPDLQPSFQTLYNVSPVYFYDRINTPVSVHHGRLDDQVPVQWSIDLCQQLDSLGKTADCFIYENMAHTFRGAGDTLFIQRAADFFDIHLK